MRRRLVVGALLSLVFYTAGAQPADVIRLTFVGDIMGHDVNYVMGDYHDIYRGVADILGEGDIAIANLEFPVDPSLPVAGYPRFNGSIAYWQAAVDSGVTVFSLANNHACDRGVEGVMQTLRAADALQSPAGKPVYVSGIRGNPARPFTVQVMAVKGMRIGFLALTQFLNRGVSSPYVDVVDYLDSEASAGLFERVREASRTVDALVVSYHGGREYAPEPEEEKAAFFRKLLENGAIIVYGHHPHVFQSYRWESVNGEKRLSLLSLGNFISGMTWRIKPDGPSRWAATGDSAIVHVDLQRDGARLTVAGVTAVPVSNYINAAGEIVVGKLEDLVSSENGLSPSWISYYKKRLSFMEKLLEPD